MEKGKEGEVSEESEGCVAYPVKALASLGGFLARKIAEAIVLGLGVTALVVVEG